MAISPPDGYRKPYHTLSSNQEEADMTTDEKIARRKLTLLELAQGLGNASKACKVMGYSRQSSTRSAATSRPMAPRA